MMRYTVLCCSPNIAMVVSRTRDEENREKMKCTHNFGWKTSQEAHLSQAQGIDGRIITAP
jgi:hypothetical protein